MGGGASSQAKSTADPAAPQRAPALSSPPVSVPSSSPGKLSPRDGHKLSCPRLSARDRVETQEGSALSNQIDSPSSPRLSRRSSQSSLHDQDSDGVNEENIDSLMYSAMSLGMDNDELLFNMFYFGEEAGSGFRQTMNTAIEETYAAHSTGNTPYKLKPATEDSIHKHLTTDFDAADIPEAEECLICQERLRDPAQSAVMLCSCKHIFHEECVLRWFTLQNWCPICRAVLSVEEDGDTKEERVAPRTPFDPALDPDCCGAHAELAPRALTYETAVADG